MKKMVQFITLALTIVLLTSGSAAGQQAPEKSKQKEAAQIQKEAEQMQKDAQLIQKRADELQKKTELTKQAQMEMDIKNAEAALESHVDAMRDYEIIRKRAEGMAGKSIIMIPDQNTWNFKAPNMEDYYFFGNYDLGGGENGNATLSLSGTCAEGAITVAIIMPDGKQLSEVIIDANGSLNWRKSFEAGEGDGWKNGKWIFKIKAKEATGNFRISMTTN
jgi:hypothetical protein